MLFFKECPECLDGILLDYQWCDSCETCTNCCPDHDIGDPLPDEGDDDEQEEPE